jgi:hypothetical protein
MQKIGVNAHRKSDVENIELLLAANISPINHLVRARPNFPSFQ